jgi:hypothetical protein
MGPCSPDQAKGRVVAVEIVDGNKVNELRAAKTKGATKEDPRALFMDITYDVAGKQGTDLRQIGTAFGLTTSQAQVLVGAPVCVFGQP